MSLKMSFMLIIFVLIYLHYNNAFRAKFTNLVCESFNKSWVVYRECRLRAVNRNKTTLSAFVFVSEPANDIIVRAQMLKKANGYKPWVIDYTFDACKFMRQRHNPFANVVWNLFKDLSTINHTCPYVGLNGVRNFYNLENVPTSLVFPNGEYLLNLTWSFDKKPQFVIAVYFSQFEDY